MKNMMDRRTDLLKETILRMKGHVHETFKNTDPYREVKMSDEEAVAQYMSFDPQVKEQFRTQSPKAYGEYEADILKKMEGMRNGRTGTI